MKHALTPPAVALRPTGLTGGSAGDIPLSRGQWLAGLLTWLAWVAVCLMAMWMTDAARAETVSWAPAATADAPATRGDAAPADATPAWQGELQQMLDEATRQAGEGVAAPTGRAPRVEVVLGRLDPRLKLAPCDKVRAYLPEGSRLWGRTRVGLRCEVGSVRWNVYWPVTVRVWGQGVVAVVPLKPGVPVSTADLRVTEVELTEDRSPAVGRVEEVVGRTVLRNIEPGQSVRQDDVRARRWFAAGEPVRVMVRGAGFAVASEGVALSHGDEGQCSRVRVDNGRVICGQPVGLRQVEVTL